jgi:CDP-glycerol glycerophosphotransferase (TagB/SpsB family)
MKKLFESSMKLLFYFLDHLFASKKYIVFSTRAAKDYADNSKVLFEKFIEEGREDVFFFTKKKHVLKTIPTNGIYAYSVKGLYILLKSKILVFTHGSSDYFPYSPGRHSKRTFVNLFHAIAVKRVGMQEDVEAMKDVVKWDYFVVSSSFESIFIKEQFGFSDDQVVVYGQPRNDIFSSDMVLEEKKQLSKRVLYAPTFRDTSETELFPFHDQDLLALDKFLSANNIEIFIRLHINDEKRVRKNESYSQLSQIRFRGAKEEPSINDVLHTYDMVISDYSSIVMDYLLLDRPVGYIIYDYDAYKEERGFSFDFHQYRAGPVIDSQKELEDFLLNEKDKYSEKRTELKNLFHKYQDGTSSERLYNFISKI